MVTPASLLRRILARLRWSQKDLAAVMGRPVSMISELATGKKRITAETAKQLQAATEVDVDVWMAAQSREDLRKARPRLAGIMTRARRMRRFR